MSTIQSWTRSSRCESGGCVEVAVLDGAIWVRNSHSPQTAVPFTSDEWAAFVEDVKSGEFDSDALWDGWPVHGKQAKETAA